MDEVQIRVETLIALLCALPPEWHYLHLSVAPRWGRLVKTLPPTLGAEGHSVQLPNSKSFSTLLLWIMAKGDWCRGCDVMPGVVRISSVVHCVPYHSAVVPVCALADFLIMPHHESL